MSRTNRFYQFMLSIISPFLILLIVFSKINIKIQIQHFDFR